VNYLSDEVEAKEVTEEIEQFGRRSICVRADVSIAVLAAVRERLGLDLIPQRRTSQNCFEANGFILPIGSAVSLAEPEQFSRKKFVQIDSPRRTLE
jgi:hypothetical protein